MYPVDLKHYASHTILATVVGLTAQSAFAQQSNTDEASAPALEEVVVMGRYQKSLQSALEQKRDSASLIEAISAEDIGQLPDVSITESLARLPGLAQDRDRGNGSQISIRGMGGQLGLTTLNGREVATVEEDRNIRYDQFPAELINAAQVYKTPQAKLAEGGVSGTINLETVAPLDYDDRVVALGVRGSVYELGSAIDDAANSGVGTRYSASYIDQFADETLGVAIGIAGQDQPIATQRAELWNYGDTWHNTQWNEAEGQSYNAPWGGSALVRGGEDSRIGGMAVIQWQPSDNVELAYDFFYSRLEIDEEQRGFDFNIDPAYERQWQVLDSVPTRYTNDDAGPQDLIAGRVGLSSLRNLNEHFSQTDELISNGLKLDWHLERWDLAADISYSETNRDREWHSVRTSNTSSDIFATFSDDGDGRLVFGLDSGVSLTDLSQNQIDNITVQPRATGNDSIGAIMLEARRELDAGIFNGVSFGVRYSDREKSQDAQIWDQFVTANSSGIDPSLVIDANADDYWSDLPEYLTLDRDAVINQYFGGLANPTPGDNNDLLAGWNVTEEITAAFVQLDIATSVAGLPLTGNIGVRAVSTDNSSSGYQLLNASTWVEQPPGSGNWVEVPPTASPVTVDNSYDDVLPSLNLALDLTNDTIVRFAAAKTIARAPLDFLSPAVDLSQDQYAPNPGESGSGNPELEPFRATQVDLSYEWYFAEGDSVAATVYYKHMDSYIARQAGAKTIVVDGSEYSLSLPVNGSGGYIRGYELMYQQAFDFLPGILGGLGVYANYAYTESNIKQGTPLYAEPFGLTGLSEHVGTATLWHYHKGFESRLSYNYRSEFQRDVNRVQGEEGVNAAEGYLDLSLSYEVNDNIKVLLQVQNLTDEPYKVYGLESNNPDHYNKYEEFGQRYVVGINWKL
ncbi:TonB-dependent receptor [uncultured Gilvimarinus sp.]|uniref:TonB-dependent receptor n=1 Tax=uncultured Gilvimarinus sp. TaxID=1689143 RepID=UPI0030D8705E